MQRPPRRAPPHSGCPFAAHLPASGFASAGSGCPFSSGGTGVTVAGSPRAVSVQAWGRQGSFRAPAGPPGARG
eukprot:3781911-Rhodomonas_salina.1